MKICAFEGCEKPLQAKMLCNAHYEMKRIKGHLVPLFSSRRPPWAALARDAQGRKECLRCASWKPEGEYNASKNEPDGLRQGCRDCQKIDSWKDRDARAARRHLRFFNITLEERDRILEAQGGVCAVCKASDAGQNGWATDHDHACCPEGGKSCGKCIRGILCNRCNLALGLARDSPQILEAMAEYVRAPALRLVAACA